MDEASLTLLGQIVTAAAAMNATDVHMSAGQTPAVVVRGRLAAMEQTPTISDTDLAGWAQAVCGPNFELLKGPDGSADGVAVAGGLRVRCAFRRQRGGLALTARLLPGTPPRLGDLRVPGEVGALINRPGGLVIVSGPTGAGKSTLLAAMVHEVNLAGGKHIMTIEEPVEYLHEPIGCRISQREVGLDVDTFDGALRAALRARPDIIVVGEMRDAATARAAIEAATKGQLVLTTSHAGSATDALEGLIGMFPAGEQQSACGRLASTLQAVIVQRLVPALSGADMVPVRELLLRTDGIAGHIRKRDFAQIYNAISTEDGAFRLESDLAEKVRAGVIDWRVAMSVANNPKSLKETLEIHAAGRTR